jgi:hypothetical protein
METIMLTCSPSRESSIDDGGVLGLATPEKITSLAITSCAVTSAEEF